MIEMLVRYCGPYLVDDLLKERLSVAKACTFNDPFEFHLRPPDEPMTRLQAREKVQQAYAKPYFMRSKQRQYPHKSAKQLKRMLKKELPKNAAIFMAGEAGTIELQREAIWEIVDDAARIICFAEFTNGDAVEIPMWGYYAACHTGVRMCVAKDTFKASQLIPVLYEDFPPECVLSKSNDSLAYAGKLIRTKSKAWEHEKETRFLANLAAVEIHPDSSPAAVKREYVSLKKQMRPCRIDLGIMATEQTQKKAVELQGVYGGLEVWKASKDKLAYRVNYERIA